MLTQEKHFPQVTTHQNTEAVATIAEWEEAASLIPRGYRLIQGFFYNSSGGRCTMPPVPLTPRQVKILTGEIQVR